MTPEQINIAIAEACGWKGVPFKQTWRSGNRDRYWRSEIPKGIHDAFEAKKCTPLISSCSCRWLAQPDGSPVMELRGGPMVNNYPTRSWNVVHTGFTAPEFPNSHTYAFGVNDPPTVEPSLVGFEKWLPDYLNDLNAMHEAENVLLNKCDNDPQDNLWIDYLANLLIAAPYCLREHATAAQRAEAYLRTLNLWKD